MAKSITLRLTRSEAIVLFETFELLEKAGWQVTPDRVGILAIRRIEAQLDKLLVEQFDPAYNEILELAKRDVLVED